MDREYKRENFRSRRTERILIALMLLALAALPLLYKAGSVAEADKDDVGSAALINQHPGILRFHVIANSDSEEDQELKLAVRNYVLAKVQKRYHSCPRCRRSNGRRTLAGRAHARLCRRRA